MRFTSLIVLTAFLWASSLQAAPISLDIDRNVNLAIGSRDFGPIAIPDDLSVCLLSFDRKNWTAPTAALSTELFVSVDGGPFLVWLGMTSIGGVNTGDSTWMKKDLPAGVNRKVKGSYVVSGARFVSTVSVACN